MKSRGLRSNRTDDWAEVRAEAERSDTVRGDMDLMRKALLAIEALPFGDEGNIL